jgi:hypothetical protein
MRDSLVPASFSNMPRLLRTTRQGCLVTCFWKVSSARSIYSQRG